MKKSPATNDWMGKLSPEENDVWQYLQPRTLKKVISFRVPPDLIDRAESAATLVDVPVCELWEAAMRKLLDELKPHLENIAKSKKR